MSTPDYLPFYPEEKPRQGYGVQYRFGRKLIPLTERRPPPKRLRYGRRIAQIGVAVTFVLMPRIHALRLDFGDNRLEILGRAIWMDEIWLLMIGVLFSAAAILTISVLYGRVFCGYACPQTILCDLTARIRHDLDRRLNAKISRNGKLASTAIYIVVTLGICLVVAFSAAAYFVAMRGPFWPIGGPLTPFATGLILTIAGVLALDTLWVRQRFCTNTCPYGAMLSVVGDNRSLVVWYDEDRGKKECIECGKCVRDCPTGIDIRQGPYQMGCIACGECIDTCNAVLPKINRAGLIAFEYGHRLGPPLMHPRLHGKERFGLFDLKRITLVVITAGMGGFFIFRMATLPPVSLDLNRISAGSTGSFLLNGGKRVANLYHITLINRDGQPHNFRLGVNGLAGLKMSAQNRRFRVEAGRARTVTVAVSAKSGQIGDRTRFLITATSVDSPDIHASVSARFSAPLF